VPDRCFYEFGPFRLDPSGRVLFRGAQAVPLPPKAGDVLVLLLQRAGDVVAKDELLKQVWHDAFVEDGSLTRTISVLRRILEQAATGSNTSPPYRGAVTGLQRR